MREWSWWEMVAQLNEESIKYVVEDGDRSRGLVGGDFRVRPNSYDHELQLQNPGKRPAVAGMGFRPEAQRRDRYAIAPTMEHDPSEDLPCGGSAEPVEPLQRD